MMDLKIDSINDIDNTPFTTLFSNSTSFFNLLDTQLHDLRNFSVVGFNECR